MALETSAPTCAAESHAKQALGLIPHCQGLASTLTVKRASSHGFLWHLLCPRGLGSPLDSYTASLSSTTQDLNCPAAGSVDGATV